MSTSAPIWPKLARLPRFRDLGNGQYTACCPAHQDRNPSLSFSIGEDGRVLLTDHAGCSPQAIVLALNCTMADLYEPLPRGSANSAGAMPRSLGRIVKTYDYRDEDGTLLYQVVRYADPKGFRQRRPACPDDDPKTVGDRWVWSIKGVRRVPYHLSELLAADPAEIVYLVEGEKDAERLIAFGLVATTTAQGADHLKFTAGELAKALDGRRVAIVQDMDDAGDGYAADAVKLLTSKAAAVAVVKLPRLKHVPTHGEDVSDWLARHGGTVEELRALAVDALEQPAAQTAQSCSAQGKGSRTDHDHLSVAWDGGVRLSQVTRERIEWLWEGYIPLRKLTMGDGDPGLGKTTLFAADMAARVTKGDHMPDGSPGLSEPAGVVVFTDEDDPADTLLPRLEAAGGDTDKVIVVKTIFRPDPETGAMQERLPNYQDLDLIERKIKEVSAKLVIFDPYVSYLPPKVDSYRDQDVRSALAPLARLAQALGVAMVLIRHLNRGNFTNALYRGMGSIGVVGAARAATLVVQDPDDENARIFGSYKHNLSKAMPSWRFRLVEDTTGTPRITWEGTSERSAQDVLSLSTERDTTSKLEAACILLREELAKAAQPQEKLETLAKSQGISIVTLRRARKMVGVTSRKVGFGKDGYWAWELASSTGSDQDGEGDQGDQDVADNGHTLGDDHLSKTVDDKLGQEARRAKDDHCSEYGHVSGNGHVPAITISLAERVAQLNAQGIHGDAAVRRALDERGALPTGGAQRE